MTPATIARRYARALAEVVFEEKIESQVTGDLQTYDEIFKAVPDLLEAFSNPAVARDAKERLLSEIMVRYPVDRITSNFFRVLLQRNRIHFFGLIFEAYLKLVNEQKGILSARVTAAEALSEPEIARLTEKLAAVTGKRVNIELQTDREILGGVVVQLGSTVYDGSVRARLSEMRRFLSER